MVRDTAGKPQWVASPGVHHREPASGPDNVMCSWSRRGYGYPVGTNSATALLLGPTVPSQQSPPRFKKPE
ncbi:unnamed protein product [Gadus morhua 'NCC']